MSKSKSVLPPCRRVAVIGGGLAGVGSVRELKAVGIEPICFEKSSDLGGTWNYRDEDIEGLPSVMSTTIINHSKELGAISNFPFPKEYPNYMSHSKVKEFSQMLAREYDVVRHIKFRTEVIKLSKSKDYEATGRYTLTVKNLDTGEVSSDVYDGVMVCSGQLIYPNMAEYPGMGDFRGKIMHSHSLKRFEEFRGKNVVVVGMGCSALDAAVEVSSVAKQVYLSCRTPSYIISRVGPNGMPVDYAYLRRYITFFQDILPLNMYCKLFDAYFIDRIFNHRLLGIKPKYSWLCREAILNDHIGSKILSGTVLMRDNIERFVEDGVYFVGEENLTAADVVIMATGYHFKIPFLDDGILEIHQDKINLYKCIYPAQLEHPTLAFIGFCVPIGPGWPMGELQIRWAAQLFSGNVKLPSTEVMKKEVDKRHAKNLKRFSPSEKISMRVDYVPYCDDLASQFGAKPNFWKMLFTDPRLFISCIFGPSLSYQYRLQGPNKWPLARETILTASERMQYPFTRGVPERSCSTTLKNFLKGNAFLILILCFIALVCAVGPRMENDFISSGLMISFSFVTIVVIICKNLLDIVVNRSFWV